jgi:hypothetical protein
MEQVAHRHLRVVHEDAVADVESRKESSGARLAAARQADGLEEADSGVDIGSRLVFDRAVGRENVMHGRKPIA